MSETQPPNETALPEGNDPIGSGKTLGLVLKKQSTMLSAVMPEWMTAERFLRQVILAAQINRDILECTAASVIRSVQIAAQLGLEPNGILGSGYLIPFKNWKNDNRKEAQFIPGYRGLLDLARRTGELLGANVKPVFEGEPFEYHEGSTPRILHSPFLDPQPTQILPDKLRGVYVIAQFGGGFQQHGWMSRAEVERVRARSRSKDSGPWKDDYIPMAMKSVVRRESKYWPLSPEKARHFHAAIEHDNRMETGEVSAADPDILRDTEEVIAEEIKAKTEKKAEDLKERVQSRKKASATARVVNDPEMEAELRRQQDMDAERSQ